MDTRHYECNNLVYSVTCTPDIHESLQNDPNYFEEYIAITTGHELTVVAENGVQAGTSKFKWDTDSTKFFIDEYEKRKEKFRDPVIRKKSLWGEILTEMRMAGFAVDNDEALDRKMRNMKKTYKTIKENMRSTGCARIYWEYFERFEQIFANDRTINCGPVLSSMSSNSTQLQVGGARPFLSTPTTSPADVPNSETILSTNPEDVTMEVPRQRTNSLHHMRKQQLLLEERKVKTAEEMLQKGEETNKLLREKNNLMRQFIDIYRGTSNNHSG